MACIRLFHLATLFLQNIHVAILLVLDISTKSENVLINESMIIFIFISVFLFFEREMLVNITAINKYTKQFTLNFKSVQRL